MACKSENAHCTFLKPHLAEDLTQTTAPLGSQAGMQTHALHLPGNTQTPDSADVDGMQVQMWQMPTILQCPSASFNSQSKCQRPAASSDTRAPAAEVMVEQAEAGTEGSLLEVSWILFVTRSACHLFSAVLNQRTSPSGHSQRPQNQKSTPTVAARLPRSAAIPTRTPCSHAWSLTCGSRL